MAVTFFPQCKEAGRRSHSSSGNQHREIRNCPSSSHPCRGAREQLNVRSALSGIILQRPCLTPVRPAFAIIKEYTIYHQLVRGLELLMASYDISAFPLSQQAISLPPMPLPCLRPFLCTISSLLLFCYSSFFKGSVVSGQTAAMLVQKTASPAPGCPCPHGRGTQCFGASSSVTMFFSSTKQSVQLEQSLLLPSLPTFN